MSCWSWKTGAFWHYGGPGAMVGCARRHPWTCRMYTFMLVKHLPLHGFLCRTCCSTTLRGFIWFSTILVSCLFPLFPPKKKSEAEKIATVCEELERFVLEHGRPPSQHSEIEGSRSLYKRLQKLKLTHKLQHDWREDVCQAVQRFYDDNAQRLPKRQNVLDDERRNEDLLAQRWERLMGQKDSASFELQQRYSALFAAVDVATEGGRVATCVAVQEFFNNRGGVLPKRQNACRSERSKDLKMRWLDVGTVWSSNSNVEICLVMCWVALKRCL